MNDPWKAVPSWGPIPACPGSWTWGKLMEIALECADEGACKGEVPVGAVIVDSVGRILSKAHNETIMSCDPTAHAEVLALRRAAVGCGNFRLNGCVLVVTLEPCLMCAGALREARVSGVVFGASDARAGAIVSCLDGLDYTRTAGAPWCYGGVEAQSCADRLRAFFHKKRMNATENENV